MTSFFGTFNPLHASPLLVMGVTRFEASASVDAEAEVGAEALGLSMRLLVPWSTAAPEALEAVGDL